MPPPRSASTQLYAFHQQFLALDETYRTQLRTIEAQYDAALTQPATAAADQQHRQRWHAYEHARRQQQEVYREVYRQWAWLYAAYQQLLLASQTTQQPEW